MAPSLCDIMVMQDLPSDSQKLFPGSLTSHMYSNRQYWGKVGEDKKGSCIKFGLICIKFYVGNCVPFSGSQPS